MIWLGSSYGKSASIMMIHIGQRWGILGQVKLDELTNSVTHYDIRTQLTNSGTLHHHPSIPTPPHYDLGFIECSVSKHIERIWT